MGRLAWFLSGGLVGSVQVLNQVYESEILKQKLTEEVQILLHMKYFVHNKLIFLHIFNLTNFHFRHLIKWFCSGTLRQEQPPEAKDYKIMGNFITTCGSAT